MPMSMYGFMPCSCGSSMFRPTDVEPRSEERRVGKSVDLGGRRIIKKKKSTNVPNNDEAVPTLDSCSMAKDRTGLIEASLQAAISADTTRLLELAGLTCTSRSINRKKNS